MPRLARSYNGEIQKDMGYSSRCSQRIQHVSVNLLLFPPSLSALLPPAAACLCAQRVSAQSSPPRRNGQALWAWDHSRIIRIPGLHIHIHAISTRPCPCHLSFNQAMEPNSPADVSGRERERELPTLNFTVAFRTCWRLSMRRDGQWDGVVSRSTEKTRMICKRKSPPLQDNSHPPQPQLCLRSCHTTIVTSAFTD